MHLPYPEHIQRKLNRFKQQGQAEKEDSDSRKRASSCFLLKKNVEFCVLVRKNRSKDKRDGFFFPRQKYI